MQFFGPTLFKHYTIMYWSKESNMAGESCLEVVMKCYYKIYTEAQKIYCINSILYQIPGQH